MFPIVSVGGLPALVNTRERSSTRSRVFNERVTCSQCRRLCLACQKRVELPSETAFCAGALSLKICSAPFGRSRTGEEVEGGRGGFLPLLPADAGGSGVDVTDSAIPVGITHRISKSPRRRVRIDRVETRVQTTEKLG